MDLSLVSDTSSTVDWDSSRASSPVNLTLDFSERRLEDMPDELLATEDLDSITELDLSHNRFLTLPPKLFQMQNLRSLNLSSNGLQSLPNEIAALQNLSHLDLRDNKLKELPESVCKLHNLKVLILSGNSFEEFPSPVLHLSALVELQMGANRLTSVPSEISKLTDLQILYLGDNRLASVPASLGSLPNLTALALAQNQIEMLPESLSNSYSLRTLTLHNNQLRALPVGLARLQNLQQLNIRNNPLVTQFVNDMTLEPPTLMELAARVVKLHLNEYSYRLSPQLQAYLQTANQCVNPKCRGVYFESYNEHIKFVDFCGRFRVPLLQYLCSSKCSSISPACAISSSINESDSSELPSTSQRIKKVLLG